ncbi:MAG: hypothetical protein WCL30_05415 [Pseudomonadota bacterium]
MSVSYLPPDILKKAVFELVEDCREKLRNGIVEVADVEQSVRVYCEAIAALPLEEGQKHREDLQHLMSEITKLGEELLIERQIVLEKISSLELLRKANNAYNKPEN